MSLQNEMRRTRLTNLQYTAKRLRADIAALTRLICFNIDLSLRAPEDMPVGDIDGQWDDLKAKWAELLTTLAEVKRLEEELS